MASAIYTLYIKRTKGKVVCVKTLPQTDANLSYHILQAHYQVMLWKAVDQQIAGAGCEPTPRIASSSCSSSSCPRGLHQLPVQNLSGKFAAVIQNSVGTMQFLHKTSYLNVGIKLSLSPRLQDTPGPVQCTRTNIDAACRCQSLGRGVVGGGWRTRRLRQWRHCRTRYINNEPFTSNTICFSILLLLPIIHYRQLWRLRG